MSYSQLFLLSLFVIDHSFGVFYAQFAFDNKLINESEVKVANTLYHACRVLIDAHAYLVAETACEVSGLVYA